MSTPLCYASYGFALLLGICLGAYEGNELGKQKAFFAQFAAILARDPLESILFGEGTDDARMDLLRAQLAFTDREFARGESSLVSRQTWLTDYEWDYARLSAFSDLKGDAARGAAYMQKAIGYCLSLGRRQEDCSAEKLRNLADIIDHRRSLPSENPK